MLEDPAKREEMIRFLRGLVSPELLAHPLRRGYDTGIRTDDDKLRKEVEIYSIGLAGEIRKMRVYCLSVLPDSTLMWSHYSANHRGVRYKKTYPEWTPQGVVHDPLALVLTKAMDWCYEREFRIVGSLQGGPAKLDGNFVPLPDGALTAIILGCESTDHAELMSIVNEYAPGLPVKRMVRVPNHYQLAIENLVSS
ncbi:MAG: hypothetical protein ABSE42_18635 [Bryobacteraceae bacterium]|jgi:hypothetical protein